jgi:hypothetical protein
MNLEIGWEPLTRVLRTRRGADEVGVEGEIHVEVRVLPLLPEAAMRALLRGLLVEKGWQQEPDGSLIRTLGAATAMLSPDGTSVTLRLCSEDTVRVVARVESEKDVDEAGVEQQLAAELERALTAARTTAREQLARENALALAKLEVELRAELQEALNRTYRRALEQRAREMGEVESIQERGETRGTYEVTIVVKA